MIAGLHRCVGQGVYPAHRGDLPASPRPATAGERGQPAIGGHPCAMISGEAHPPTSYALPSCSLVTTESSRVFPSSATVSTQPLNHCGFSTWIALVMVRLRWRGTVLTWRAAGPRRQRARRSTYVILRAYGVARPSCRSRRGPGGRYGPPIPRSLVMISRRSGNQDLNETGCNIAHANPEGPRR